MIAEKFAIEFNHELCKGCLICAKFCPKNVFEATDDSKVRVARPQDCVGCRACENRCPDYALEILQNAEAKAEVKADVKTEVKANGKIEVKAEVKENA